MSRYSSRNDFVRFVSVSLEEEGKRGIELFRCPRAFLDTDSSFRDLAFERDFYRWMEEWARKGGGRSVAHARLEPTFRLCDPTRPNVLSPYERNPTFVTRALTVPSSVIQGDKPRTKSGHGAIARSNFDREEGKGRTNFSFQIWRVIDPSSQRCIGKVVKEGTDLVEMVETDISSVRWRIAAQVEISIGDVNIPCEQCGSLVVGRRSCWPRRTRNGYVDGVFR